MPVEDNLPVCMLFDKINILRCNVWPVQIGDVDHLLVSFHVIPDISLHSGAVEDFDAEFLQCPRVGLFFQEIVPQELHHKALFGKQLQILVGCFGSGVLIKGRNIVVYEQNITLPLSPLSCTKRIRIPGIDILCFQFFLPLLLKLLLIHLLIAL